MHKLGLVHRNFRPDVIFQSTESRRPLFIAGHEYTTTHANTDLNTNLPNNPYIIRDPGCRAGSKKQDLVALGGIILAWQVGVTKFEQRMKKKADWIE
jgi:hypothetical protein